MVQLQVSFGEAIKRAFSQYCCFSGRASRSEYWWFVLFTILVNIFLNIVSAAFTVGGTAGGGLVGMVAGSTVGLVLQLLWSLAILLPQLGLAWRRMHDTGKGGGWYFINLIPIVGSIIFLVFTCQESEMQANRFGEVPNLR